MSLPAHQQRLLDRIEVALQASEPNLASMFAIFTRLTRDEEPASRERLRGSRLPDLRQFVLVPVMLAMLLTGALLGSTAHGAVRCGTGRLIAVGVAGEARCGAQSRSATQPSPAPPATRTGLHRTVLQMR